MALLVGILLLFLAVLAFAVLAGVPTWLLWNALLPELFNLPRISLWQAMGLLILSGLLFKNGTSSSSKKD